MGNDWRHDHDVSVIANKRQKLEQLEQREQREQKEDKISVDRVACEGDRGVLRAP